jgi:hypothetical protein
MTTEVTLSLGDGYAARAVPSVAIDIYGVTYRARKPKNTTPILLSEVQARFTALGELNENDPNAAQDALAEARRSTRLLVRAMFDDTDTDAIMTRLIDPAEERLDLSSMFEIYGLVQTHFADDIAGEYEDMGLEPPEPVKKAAKKAAVKKAVGRGSGKPGARKAVARRAT